MSLQIKQNVFVVPFKQTLEYNLLLYSTKKQTLSKLQPKLYNTVFFDNKLGWLYFIGENLYYIASQTKIEYFGNCNLALKFIESSVFKTI